jgi:tetratricopeptide (TPR) repeat protein
MICYFKIAFLLLFVAEINSCVQKHPNGANVPSKECIELNNRGVEYLKKFPTDKMDINEAIRLFKQAVICDSTYAIGYENLANAYERNHSYSEEIIALNKVLTLTENAAPILLEKGKAFERTNNIDSAKKIYYLANLGFEKRLLKQPGDAEVIKELILLKALMVGKDEAVKEINAQIKLHPELKESLSGEYEYYKTFNRRAFIYNLPTEIK